MRSDGYSLHPNHARAHDTASNTTVAKGMRSGVALGAVCAYVTAMWADLPERIPEAARNEQLLAAQAALRDGAARAVARERIDARLLRGAMAWAVALYHLGILARALAGGTRETGVVAAPACTPRRRSS